MAGTKYGKWTAGEKLDSGGQGDVYKIRDNGKDYAIKVIKVKPGNQKKLQRAKQEISIIKQLDTAANIIKIYDENLEQLDENATTSQEVWYVMDYARFGSLRDNDFYLNDVELGLTLFIEILKGVDAAHKKKIIHRDIKPENILLYPTQKSIVISDFGLGLLVDTTDHVTDPDEVLGPKHFISPEQYKSPSSVTVKSDIYSLGKVLYFILTGKGKVYREEIGDLSVEFTGAKQYLPLVQERLLNKMVATEPKNRFDSVTEIIEEAEKILTTISRNTQRFIQKAEKDFSIYDVLIAGRRQEFIDDFSSDLARNVRLLGWVANELYVEEKSAILEELKKDLLEKYTRAKPRAAIEAAFMSIEKPEDLKKHEGEKYSFAAYFLAKYFERASSHQLAHEHLVKAIEKEPDAALSLEYLLLLSKISKKCTCGLPHDFDKRVTTLLQSTADDDQKAQLYKILGEHYLDLDNKLQGLRFLEAYLFLKPYDNEVRFNCAHAYDGEGQTALALHHYLIYQQAEEKSNASVNNNLGVIYGSNDMSIKAMETYRKAHGDDNTLAGSNIALELLNIGMVDKAQEILRKIIADHPDGKYHERVHWVMAQIATRKENEEEKFKKFVADGDQLSELNRQNVDALSKTSFDWIGYWNTNEGSVIEIRAVDGKLSASRRGTDKKAFDLEFDGNSANVIKVELGISDTFTSGVLFMIGANDFKGYAQKSDNTYKSINAIRIPDIEAYEKQQTANIQSLLANYKSLGG